MCGLCSHVFIRFGPLGMCGELGTIVSTIIVNPIIVSALYIYIYISLSLYIYIYIDNTFSKSPILSYILGREVLAVVPVALCAQSAY